MESASQYALREEDERRQAQAQAPRHASGRNAAQASAWEAETRAVAKESEQVADLLGQLGQIVDGHDDQLDSIVDANGDTVDTLLDGTLAVGQSGKDAAARTHKRTVPLAVGAVSGVVGGIALTPILGVVTGAVGAALGYGVGTKVSGAIEGTIEGELQQARDIAENDGQDRGPLVETDLLEWMWGDVGLGKLAHSNPLRWSSGTPTQTARELRAQSERDQARPVVFRWKRAGRDSSASFASVREAVAWIEDTINPRAQAARDWVAEATPPGGGGASFAALPRGGLAAEYGNDRYLQKAVQHAARAG